MPLSESSTSVPIYFSEHPSNNPSSLLSLETNRLGVVAAVAVGYLPGRFPGLAWEEIHVADFLGLFTGPIRSCDRYLVLDDVRRLSQLDEEGVLDFSGGGSPLAQ